MNEDDDIPPFQHKPEKKKNYEERIRSGEQQRWDRKPRKAIKPVSSKKTSELARYNRESQAWLRGKSCALCGANDNLSIHHAAGRGKNLNVKEYWIPLCLIGSETWLKNQYPDSNHSHSGGCHGFVEANKLLAEKLGFIIRTYSP